jgi:hypothetical protein
MIPGRTASKIPKNIDPSLGAHSSATIRQAKSGRDIVTTPSNIRMGPVNSALKNASI